jgi:hypothetical protein
VLLLCGAGVSSCSLAVAPHLPVWFRHHPVLWGGLGGGTDLVASVVVRLSSSVALVQGFSVTSLDEWAMVASEVEVYVHDAQ